MSGDGPARTARRPPPEGPLGPLGASECETSDCEMHPLRARSCCFRARFPLLRARFRPLARPKFIVCAQFERDFGLSYAMATPARAISTPARPKITVCAQISAISALFCPLVVFLFVSGCLFDFCFVCVCSFVSGSLWQHLGASRSIWESLGASGSIWESLAATACDCLRLPATACDCLRLPVTACDCLRLPATACDGLRLPATAYDCLRLLRRPLIMFSVGCSLLRRVSFCLSHVAYQKESPQVATWLLRNWPLLGPRIGDRKQYAFWVHLKGLHS